MPRRHVVGAHIAGYLGNDKRLRIFGYGHTHEFEKGWPWEVAEGNQIVVHNTGAFQRTTDE
ncbi:MAG TPA: hypothetical protein VMM15_22625, partial [Bradyrhizobium sp.]|nr:hypothetical protein [Bradyrhizobium sp.]